jgi:hypothetical protein
MTKQVKELQNLENSYLSESLIQKQGRDILIPEVNSSIRLKAKINYELLDARIKMYREAQKLTQKSPRKPIGSRQF